MQGGFSPSPVCIDCAEDGAELVVALPPSCPRGCDSGKAEMELRDGKNQKIIQVGLGPPHPKT